jgi:SAM-dependent methyltransferase
LRALADGPVGLSFGRVADEYERARPEYPAAAIDRAAAELGLEASATVLDLAAGTGKLTRTLRTRFAHVIAVEPDDDMRARIDGDARDGRAEHIPVETGGVDAVFVGDAFHWFEPGAAIAEIRRVLRPGGGVALLWNHWAPGDAESPRLTKAARALLDRPWKHFHGDRGHPVLSWEEDVEAAFGPFGTAEFTTELCHSGDLFADLCITASCPAALPDDERTALRHELRAQLADDYVLLVRTELSWGRA